MNLDDLSDSYRKMYYGIGDYAEPEEQKKGIHDVRRFTTYPAFPWKFDGTDHSKDNARTFYEIAERSGIAKHMRKEDDPNNEPLLTYSQWLERHKDEPGFVNHIAEVVR